MTAQSFLAKNGLRSKILGTAAALAIAAPLSAGDDSPAAHTDAARIGWYFDRTAGDEKVSSVVMGTEALSVFDDRVEIPLTNSAVSSITGALRVVGGIATQENLYVAGASFFDGGSGVAGVGLYVGNGYVFSGGHAGTSANIAFATNLDIGSMTTSDLNVFVGDSIDASLLTSGNQNTVVGSQTSIQNDFSGNVVIGEGASGGADNAISIGRLASTSGTGSVSIGPSSSTSGSGSISIGSVTDSVIGAVSIGRGSRALGTNSVVLGEGAFTDNEDNITIGHDANSSGGGNTGICIGSGSRIKNGSGNSVVVGNEALIDGNSDASVAIGEASSVSSAGGSVVVGQNSSSTGARSTVIGTSAGSGHEDSIAIGKGSSTTGTNQVVIGSGASSIAQAYIGNGVTNASPINIGLNATGGNGTDIAGANLTLAGGKGTGAGAPGSILLRTAPAGTSGTTANALETVATVTGSAFGINKGFVQDGINTVTGAGGSPDETADGADAVFYLDGSSSTCTLALDPTPTTGQRYEIKSIDSSNTVTVDGNGNTIDGSATTTLATDEALTAHYDGSEWRIL